MKNKVKIVGALAVALMLNACAGGTYKIKSENGKTMNQVPKWYMADFSERKAVSYTHLTLPTIAIV